VLPGNNLPKINVQQVRRPSKRRFEEKEKRIRNKVRWRWHLRWKKEVNEETKYLKQAPSTRIIGAGCLPGVGGETNGLIQKQKALYF